MPELWERSGVRPDLRVKATNIRKWIVTECHNRKIQGAKFDEDIVRQGLCHSDKTAKSFYLRSEKTSVAAQSADIITSCTIGKAAASTNEQLHQQSEKEKFSTCTSPKAPAIESMVEDEKTPESPICSSLKRHQLNPPSKKWRCWRIQKLVCLQVCRILLQLTTWRHHHQALLKPRK